MKSLNTIVNLLKQSLGKAPAESSKDTTHRQFIRGSIGGLGFNVIANTLFFIISIMLARYMGASGYGIYIYAISWIMVLGVFSDFGLNRLLVRNIASYHTHEQWGLLKGQLLWALKIAILASLSTVVIAFSISYFFRESLPEEMLIPFWIALLLLPLTTLMRCNQAALRGLHQVVLGQVAEVLTQPLTLFLMICIAIVFIPDSIDATIAVSMFVFSVAICLALSIKLLIRHVPASTRNVQPELQKSLWLRSALSMLLLGGLHIINSRTDIIMLGSMAGTDVTGIYGVCVRGSDLVMFFFIPVATALMPTVAKLYSSGKLAELQKIVTVSTRTVFMISAPIAIILSVFGNLFLFLYGSEFQSGQWALAILCTGKIISLGIGPAALLLTMTGHEKKAALGVGASAVANVILNAIMIPIWGLEGAAIATTISTVFMVAVLALWVHDTLNIRTDIFAARL